MRPPGEVRDSLLHPCTCVFLRVTDEDGLRIQRVEILHDLYVEGPWAENGAALRMTRFCSFEQTKHGAD